MNRSLEVILEQFVRQPLVIVVRNVMVLHVLLSVIMCSTIVTSLKVSVKLFSQTENVAPDLCLYLVRCTRQFYTGVAY